jgi:hypothetical protein
VDHGPDTTRDGNADHVGTPAGSDREQPTGSDDEQPAGQPGGEQPRSGPVTFTRHVVDSAVSGPAFVSVADLDGDGQEELVVSAFGEVLNFFSPDVRIYTRGQTLGDWTSVSLSSGFRFPNQTVVSDVDDDGDLDIILPAGFFACQFFAGNCGALAWFEQTGGRWLRHDLQSGEQLFHHNVNHVDFDGDGVKDLVTVGERFAPPDDGHAEARWFRGLSGPDRFEKTPRKLSDGLGSFPRVLDLDGDGDLDIGSAEFFVEGGSFAWLERGPATAAKPEGTFIRHVIDDNSGPSIMMTFIDDLFGDGQLRAVGANHTNTQRQNPDPWESAIFVFDVPADPKERWPKRQISQGIVSRPGDAQLNRFDAPGIIGHGDVDGDGDIDIVVSGDGDDRVFWLEQAQPGQFVTHVLDTGLGQAGGMKVTDLDHDGKAEIVVTVFERNAVYLYEVN